MPIAVKTVTLPLPFRIGKVNCYLIDADGHHVLVDTGGSNARKQLMDALQRAGCTRDTLQLVLLTHGDFDHIGNAAFIRSAFGVRLAMHPGDLGMAERGDMFANRNKPSPIVRALLPIFSPFGKAQRFTPDMLLQAGDNLSRYGFSATVVHIPGHSPGSVAFHTLEGSLFCGDLLESTSAPALNSLMDDPRAAEESLERLRTLKIGTVYPGHGSPFPMEVLGREQAGAG